MRTPKTVSDAGNRNHANYVRRYSHGQVRTSVASSHFNRVAAPLASLLVSVQYNIDGDCVNETAAGVTTQYLIDTLNSTGLPKAMDELGKASSRKLQVRERAQMRTGRWVRD